MKIWVKRFQTKHKETLTTRLKGDKKKTPKQFISLEFKQLVPHTNLLGKVYLGFLQVFSSL